MITIAICDDDSIFVDLIKQTIQEYFADNQINIPQCFCFTDSKQFLDSTQEHKYDFIFLDIEMPNLNGIEIGKALKHYGESFLVYVTSREDLVFDAVFNHPYGFVRKKNIEKELPIILRDMLLDYNKTIELFSFKNQGVSAFLKLHQIYYFESCKNIIIIHTATESYKFRDSLLSLESRLESKGFIRVHTGYLVNCIHIRNISHAQAVLDDDRIVPISRARYKTIKKTFCKIISDLKL